MHKTTKILIPMILFSVVATIPGTLYKLGYLSTTFLSYEWLKSIHVVGAILLLGNIVVTGFWMFIAERSRNEQAIRFAAVTVNWMDVLFTAPGVILIMATGALLFPTWGELMGQFWIRAGLYLFSLSGVIWVIFLIPMQDRMARTAEMPEPLPSAFFVTLHKWYVLGFLATLTPLAATLLMVLKPI